MPDAAEHFDRVRYVRCNEPERLCERELRGNTQPLELGRSLSRKAALITFLSWSSIRADPRITTRNESSALLRNASALSDSSVVRNVVNGRLHLVCARSAPRSPEKRLCG